VQASAFPHHLYAEDGWRLFGGRQPSPKPESVWRWTCSGLVARCVATCWPALAEFQESRA